MSVLLGGSTSLTRSHVSRLLSVSLTRPTRICSFCCSSCSCRRQFSTSTSTSTSSSTKLTPLPLIPYGHPTLLNAAAPFTLDEIRQIKQPGSSLRLRIASLALTQHQQNGYGIAAPQVGWSKCVFAMGNTDEKWIREYAVGTPSPSSSPSSVSDPNDFPFMIWINPVIQSTTDTKITTCWFWEGCLSIPNMVGWVPRPNTVSVYGYDHTGSRRMMTLTGLAARCFQHEFDHLQGILYPSRVTHPTHLVPAISVTEQHTWQKGWPSKGAHQTPFGTFSHIE